MSFIVPPKRGAKPFNEAAISAEMAELAARETEIAQRVKRELAKCRAQAEAEGREAGYAEGFAVGTAAGQAAMQSAAAALASAISQLTDPLAIKQADLAALVTKLSRTLAGHIIGCETTANAGPITALANKLLAQAAAERMAKSRVALRLNPADHAALSDLSLPADTMLSPDPTIAQGSAILEITAPQTACPVTIWDATIPTRLAALQ